jgi:hypothetical protein
MRAAKLLLAVALLAAAGATDARDDHLMFPVAEALSTPAAREKLDPKISLHFGKEKRPAVARSIGTWTTNKKTNSFGKSDKDACEWAFLSAMLALQERARKEGGDAVIAIESVYKDVVTSREKEYVCGAGAFVAGVAFRGEVVTLAR